MTSTPIATSCLPSSRSPAGAIWCAAPPAKRPRAGARDYLPDALAAALSVPLATDWRPVTFAPDAYWRGETHRLCDRPGSLIRVLEELAEVGVEQAVIVTAAAESPGPHTLA